MAGKTDFTEDEWKTLSKGVTGSGMLVSVAHRDFTDSFGEATALAREMAEQHTHSQSQLVRELGATRGTGFGLASSPAKVEAETLAALGAAVTLLGAKAPDELEAYRAFVLDIAQTVAAAKGGVRPEEAATIEKVKSALGA